MQIQAGRSLTSKRFARFTLLPIVAAAAFFFTASDARGIADNFADAPVLTGRFEVSLLPFTMDDYTREMGEPLHGPVLLDRTGWVRWIAPIDGLCTVETINPSIIDNTQLAIYTGNTLASLTRVAAGDDSVSTRSASVTFYATAGSTYRIAVAIQPIFKASTSIRLRQRPNGPRAYRGTWESPLEDTVRGANGEYSINITATGAATGVVTAGATRHRFKAIATTDGYLHAVLPSSARPGTTVSAPVTITVDLAAETTSEGLRGFYFSDGTTIHGTGVVRHQSDFTKENPTPFAGRYTLGITPDASMGNGYLLAVVAPTGLVRMIGETGDGQKLVLGTALTDANIIPFHSGSFGGDGYFRGRVGAQAGNPNRLIGTTAVVRQRRPPQPGSPFSSGFVSPVAVDGRIYPAPATGQRPLGFLDATGGAGVLSVIDAPGELAAFMESLILDPRGGFAFSSTVRKPRLKLNLRTGFVSGAITAPAGNVRKIRGVLYQDSNTIVVRGYLSGTNRTVRFSIAP